MNDVEKSYPVRDELSQIVLDGNSSLAKMFSLVGSGKRVLDAGCASGYLARMLTYQGCSVVGIDINPDAVAEAATYCSRAFVADLNIERLNEIFPTERFDVAIFGDVLEHLGDPWRVLDDARSILAPGGAVVVSIPNVAHGAIRLALLDGKFDYKEFGILDDTHLRFFTRRTVNELFVRCGYEVETAERTVLPLFEPSNLVPALSPDDYAPETIARVREDPDVDTLQFVVRAVPLDDATKAERLNKAFVHASAEAALTLDTLARTKATLQNANAEMTRAQTAYQEAFARAENLQNVVHQQKSLVDAMGEEARRREDEVRRYEGEFTRREQAEQTLGEVTQALVLADRREADARVNIGKLEAARNRAADDLRSVRRELLAAEERLAAAESLQRPFALVKERFDALTRQHTELEAAFRRLAAETKDARGRAVVAERSILSYLGELADVNGSVAWVAKSGPYMALMRHRFPAQLKALNDLATRLGQADRAATDREAYVDELTTALATCNAQLDTMRGVLAEREEQVAALSEGIAGRDALVARTRTGRRAARLTDRFMLGLRSIMRAR